MDPTLSKHTPEITRAWNSSEMEILSKWYPRGGYELVTKRLPHRSKASIYSMAHSLDLKIRKTINPGKRLNVETIARGMGVSPQTVSLWIRSKNLDSRIKDGHPIVTEAALRRWISAHAKTINLSLVDRVWFVGLAFAKR